ncbi:hypothetical protein I315_01078 [Cryptococcus gattii Ru294]|nr:hypothetical protein I315_01078 [Cryptococcus gattii Ru294]
MPPPGEFNFDQSSDESPELLPRDALPETDHIPEVSMVEESTVTGVTFTPELWMQRRQWALQTLRKEGVRSVLDLGCGPGALLETLVMPPSTICEPPIREESYKTQHAEDEEEDFDQEDELFISRLAGIDANPEVMNPALSVISPASETSTFPPPRPRWEPITTELWLGGLEKYNARLEGYEAITALEVIEHLDPNVLSRFGVVTLGTYRPRIMLISTPNFDFNAKFPKANGDCFARKGFVDPTGRTDRVFRHSDHKIEMTGAEFRNWAETAAADWGYYVEVSGVGSSSIPSFYPCDDITESPRPIYASQTAIFRIATGMPLRSPRSVRTMQLPFTPSSKESSHPHKLAGRFTLPATAPGIGQRSSPEEVRAKVRDFFTGSSVNEVSLAELWGVLDIAGACGGSKRWLVGSLGGYGDCPALDGNDEDEFEFKVKKVKGMGLAVQWKEWTPRAEEIPRDWGTPVQNGREHASHTPAQGW